MKTQSIYISDTRTIYSIREDFQHLFPFLKLEFFSKPHQPGEPSMKKQMKDGNQTLKECRRVHNDGEIIISPGMTVAELEQQFLASYGLSVQVFRKSGKLWLETTVTDSWTLQEQNSQGEALSRPEEF